MITHKQFQEAVVTIKLYMQQIDEGIKRAEQYHLSKPTTLIGEHDLSIRAINVLLRHNISQYDTVQTLSKLTKNTLWNTRQCGKRTIDEIEALCEKAGINLEG